MLSPPTVQSWRLCTLCTMHISCQLHGMRNHLSAPTLLLTHKSILQEIILDTESGQFLINIISLLKSAFSTTFPG